MNAHRPSANGWSRPVLILFAIAGLLALAFYCFDRPGRQPAKPMSQEVHPVERLGEQPRVARVRPILAPGVASMDGVIVEEAPWRAADATDSNSRPSRQPFSLQFNFLGKIAQGDETLVLLYGGGRTLTVRGIGPLDDDYVVDAFDDAYLVLRHASLGESQIVQLVSRESPVSTGWSAENTPQD